MTTDAAPAVHCIIDYTRVGGDDGDGPITAYCRCGETSTADTVEAADEALEAHLPPHVPTPEPEGPPHLLWEWNALDADEQAEVRAWFEGAS